MALTLACRRESIGLHTCDERSSKSYLEETYPSFGFETPFSEHVRRHPAVASDLNSPHHTQDELWNPTYGEMQSQQALRTQQLLNEVDHHVLASNHPR